MYNKGQGAAEFIIILSVVLILALFSSLIINYFIQTPDIRIAESRVYWLGITNGIQLQDWNLLAVYDSSIPAAEANLTILAKNPLNRKITLRQIQITQGSFDHVWFALDGTYAGRSNDLSIVLNPGDSVQLIVQHYENGVLPYIPLEVYELDTTFIYDTSSISSFSQNGSIPIIGKRDYREGSLGSICAGGTVECPDGSGADSCCASSNCIGGVCKTNVCSGVTCDVPGCEICNLTTGSCYCNEATTPPNYYCLNGVSCELREVRDCSDGLSGFDSGVMLCIDNCASDSFCNADCICDEKQPKPCASASGYDPVTQYCFLTPACPVDTLCSADICECVNCPAERVCGSVCCLENQICLNESSGTCVDACIAPQTQCSDLCCDSGLMCDETQSPAVCTNCCPVNTFACGANCCALNQICTDSQCEDPTPLCLPTQTACPQLVTPPDALCCDTPSQYCALNSSRSCIVKSECPALSVCGSFCCDSNQSCYDGACVDELPADLLCEYTAACEAPSYACSDITNTTQSCCNSNQYCANLTGTCCDTSTCFYANATGTYGACCASGNSCDTVNGCCVNAGGYCNDAEGITCCGGAACVGNVCEPCAGGLVVCDPAYMVACCPVGTICAPSMVSSSYCCNAGYACTNASGVTSCCDGGNCLQDPNTAASMCCSFGQEVCDIGASSVCCPDGECADGECCSSGNFCQLSSTEAACCADGTTCLSSSGDGAKCCPVSSVDICVGPYGALSCCANDCSTNGAVDQYGQPLVDYSLCCSAGESACYVYPGGLSCCAAGNSCTNIMDGGEPLNEYQACCGAGTEVCKTSNGIPSCCAAGGCKDSISNPGWQVCCPTGNVCTDDSCCDNSCSDAGGGETVCCPNAVDVVASYDGYGDESACCPGYRDWIPPYDDAYGLSTIESPPQFEDTGSEGQTFCCPVGEQAYSYRHIETNVVGATCCPAGEYPDSTGACCANPSSVNSPSGTHLMCCENDQSAGLDENGAPVCCNVDTLVETPTGSGFLYCCNPPSTECRIASSTYTCCSGNCMDTYGGLQACCTSTNVCIDPATGNPDCCDAPQACVSNPYGGNQCCDAGQSFCPSPGIWGSNDPPDGGLCCDNCVSNLGKIACCAPGDTNVCVSSLNSPSGAQETQCCASPNQCLRVSPFTSNSEICCIPSDMCLERTTVSTTPEGVTQYAEGSCCQAPNSCQATGDAQAPNLCCLANYNVCLVSATVTDPVTGAVISPAVVDCCPSGASCNPGTGCSFGGGGVGG